jgi:hypothetical protein
VVTASQGDGKTKKRRRIKGRQNREGGKWKAGKDRQERIGRNGQARIGRREWVGGKW